MNIEKRIAISLHSIKEKIEANNTSDATKDLDRLWKVVNRLGKNNEAINIGVGLHSEETIKNANTENRIILGSNLPLHEILLAK